MSTAEAFEDVHRDAEYFEYSKAADPIGLKLISRVPYHNFPASLAAANSPGARAPGKGLKARPIRSRRRQHSHSGPETASVTRKCVA